MRRSTMARLGGILAGLAFLLSGCSDESKLPDPPRRMP